jgi:protein SCO1
MSHPLYHILYIVLSISLSISCSREKGRVTEDLAGEALPKTLSGIRYDPPRLMFDIKALDQHEERFVLTKQEHPLAMVFFGYTACTDVCPTNLKRFEQIQQIMGREADQVLFVFVTIDPARETPQVMRRYLKRYKGEIMGVTGSPSQLERVYDKWGIVRKRVEVSQEVDPRGYKFDHTGQIFLVRDGERLLVSYPYGTDAETMAQELSAVLRDPSVADRLPPVGAVRDVTIPKGSFTKRGQQAGGLPTYLRLRLGDTVRWRNADFMYHTVGDIRLAPETSATQRFDEEGTFYLGCTAIPEDTIRISVQADVTPRKIHELRIPPGTASNRKRSTLPKRLDIVAGDTIRWRNDDYAFHVIGDLVLPPESSAEQELNVPGERLLGCSALEEGTMRVVIKP